MLIMPSLKKSLIVEQYFKGITLNILTIQKWAMTELTLVWPVNMTGHGPKLFWALYFQQTHQFSQSNQK